MKDRYAIYLVPGVLALVLVFSGCGAADKQAPRAEGRSEDASALREIDIAGDAEDRRTVGDRSIEQTQRSARLDREFIPEMAVAANSGDDSVADDRGETRFDLTLRSAETEMPSAIPHGPVSEESADPPLLEMAVMQPAEVESDLPPSQTTLKVFYATDRKAEFGLSDSDWLQIHQWAIVAAGVYLVTFALVFYSRAKIFFGSVAFGSLIVFLVLGHAATINWQKQKRLAEHGDANYVAEIRPQSIIDEPLDYGVCRVTIPPDHKIGHLDSPSLFKLEFREDPQKHVVLHRVERSDHDEFYAELNDELFNADRDQALVFVHGYNVSFADAVKRTAQIAHDLRFDGVPICYSWASHGALANYTKDMANADATVTSLQRFLEETLQRTDKTTIHLVAHSMGNRALLQALDRIAVSRTSDHGERFGQLVMAAPDVSARDFQHRFVPSAQKLTSRMTLYASSKDRALLASTEIHGHDRAGLAGDQLVVMPGLDTIDVSEIDTSLIGHSYYGDHPELIKDLRALVELAQPASQRSWLTRLMKPGGFDYYQFEQIRSATDHRKDETTR